MKLGLVAVAVLAAVGISVVPAIAKNTPCSGKKGGIARCQGRSSFAGTAPSAHPSRAVPPRQNNEAHSEPFRRAAAGWASARRAAHSSPRHPLRQVPNPTQAPTHSVRPTQASAVAPPFWCGLPRPENLMPPTRAAALAHRAGPDATRTRASRKDAPSALQLVDASTALLGVGKGAVLRSGQTRIISSMTREVISSPSLVLREPIAASCIST